MGFGNLRVINEDRVAAGAGFGTHGHKDMEIISYVLSGELAHKDSMGNVESIPPGDVQRMSAGRGVMHSEFNHKADETTHFLLIWIEPNVRGIPPSYEQKTFPEGEKRGKLRLVASPDGADGSVRINQDAKLFVSLLSPGDEIKHSLGAGRYAWLQVAKGEIELNGKELGPGDGAAASEEKELTITASMNSEVLLFDLA